MKNDAVFLSADLNNLARSRAGSIPEQWAPGWVLERLDELILQLEVLQSKRRAL